MVANSHTVGPPTVWFNLSLYIFFPLTTTALMKSKSHNFNLIYCQRQMKKYISYLLILCHRLLTDGSTKAHIDRWLVKDVNKFEDFFFVFFIVDLGRLLYWLSMYEAKIFLLQLNTIKGNMYMFDIFDHDVIRLKNVKDDRISIYLWTICGLWNKCTIVENSMPSKISTLKKMTKRLTGIAAVLSLSFR